MFLLVVMAAWWFAVRPMMEERHWSVVTADFALCGEREGAEGCVVDGDSLVLGSGADRRRIRLTGFDAPEIKGECEAERRLAVMAREALSNWLAQGDFEWDGGGSAPRDRFGRELREVRRITSTGKYEYLADAMISRGLAAQSGWNASGSRWCD